MEVVGRSWGLTNVYRTRNQAKHLGGRKEKEGEGSEGGKKGMMYAPKERTRLDLSLPKKTNGRENEKDRCLLGTWITRVSRRVRTEIN